jgi:putative ABC transport system ATP-binding protein
MMALQSNLKRIYKPDSMSLIQKKLIQTKSLSKLFKRGEEEIWALKDISLDISAGEFITITGASGSGKSTLLYLLGLLDRPTDGSYFFNDREVSKLDDNELSELRNKKMGFVFQSFHLLGTIDALRNVSMPLIYSQNYGVKITRSEIRKRAEDALAMVGLADRKYHLPNQLSGGQRQRVAIARALVSDPEVIFADEPTGNLDSNTSKEIVKLLRELNANGRTIILVTHDQELAKSSPRLIIVKDGKISGDSSVPE